MAEQNEVERCGFLFVHDDVVKKVMEEMPEESVPIRFGGAVQALWRHDADSDSIRAI